MRKPFLIALFVFIALAPVAPAADVWVMGGFVGYCSGLQWWTDALVFNTLPAPAVVRLVSVSDGPDNVSGPARELEVLPRQTLGLASNTVWRPHGDAPFFMLHLDVPEGVVIEAILNLGTGIGGSCLLPAPDGSAAYGIIHFPHFRALVPAYQEQIHLGTTLGSQWSRNNVGIYNASAFAATASVTLRRACDDRIVDETTVQLDPNSTTQVRLENKTTDRCIGRVKPWIDYVTVTVDQPSLSWVSTLANGVDPRVLLTIR